MDSGAAINGKLRVGLRSRGSARPAALVHARPDPARLTTLLERDYGLSVRSLDVIHEGNEGFKFVAHTEQGQYFVKAVAAAQVHALKFAAEVTSALSRRGFRGVLQPLAALRGGFVSVLDDSVVKVRPFIEGTPIDAAPPSASGPSELGRMLGELHTAGRDLVLDEPLSDGGQSFAEDIDHVIESATHVRVRDPRRRAAGLVLDCGAALREAAGIVDSLRPCVDAARVRWVVTHGDSQGNVVVDPNGRKYFIDWTDAAMAPPERDVVHYAGSGFEAFLAGYLAAASTDRFSSTIMTYYLHRWQVEGVVYYGSRLFDAVLRLFIPYRFDAVADALAILRRALPLA
jgi:Ser/Thr protein kinase RdoA (MazF antagonist)